MVSLEDHIEEVVVLDVLDPPCVYTFIGLENKNEHRNSRTWYVRKGTEDAGTTGLIFLIFIVEGVFEGAVDPIFLTYKFFTFCLTLTFYQPYESMTGPIVQRVLT
jgi:hypothetical protein